MPRPLLPPELLDHTIDLLHDERDALRSCSLVSKSWIPRTRKHLFASVRFYTVANLQSWKATFPDPSSSPAYHTQYLSIRCPPIATIINAEEADLISTFSQVVHLEVDMRNRDAGPGQQAVSVISLVQFHGFSSLLKSLSMNSLVLPPSQLLNFITSFPLLEDISLDTFYDALVGEDASDGLPTTIKPSTPPLLTGCLKLAVWQGIDLIAPRLLSLPNNLRFRKLDFTWHCKGDVPLTEALVEDCHSTLEHLTIDDGILGALARHLCLHKLLTTLCRRATVSARQPRQSNRTQRRSIFVLVEPSMDLDDTPNCHTWPQSAQTDRSWHGFWLGLHWCRHYRHSP